jgi:hypothetical protein
MKRFTLLTELLAEAANYETSFNEIGKTKQSAIEFDEKNKNLTDDLYFEKINAEFPKLKTINKIALLKHQRKTARNTAVIMWIMIIYFIASIITAIVLLTNSHSY